MAANFSRVVFNTSGVVQMIIHPDLDSQLNDPAFSPPNTIVADIPRGLMRGLGTQRDLLATCLPIVAAKNAAAGSAIAAAIAALDAPDNLP